MVRGRVMGNLCILYQQKCLVRIRTLNQILHVKSCGTLSTELKLFHLQMELYSMKGMHMYNIGSVACCAMFLSLSNIPFFPVAI